MTKQEFYEVFAMLETAYTMQYKKMSTTEKDRHIELWSAIFRNYDSTLVKNAVLKYISSDTTGFPPAPGHITEIIHDLIEPNKMTDEEAWKLVKEAIADGNYNAEERFDELPNALQRAVGSPQMLKNYAMYSSKEIQYVKRDIMDSYRSAIKSEKSQKLNNMLAIEANRVMELERKCP